MKQDTPGKAVTPAQLEDPRDKKSVCSPPSFSFAKVSRQRSCGELEHTPSLQPSSKRHKAKSLELQFNLPTNKTAKQSRAHGVPGAPKQQALITAPWMPKPLTTPQVPTFSLGAQKAFQPAPELLRTGLLREPVLLSGNKQAEERRFGSNDGTGRRGVPQRQATETQPCLHSSANAPCVSSVLNDDYRGESQIPHGPSLQIAQAVRPTHDRLFLWPHQN